MIINTTPLSTKITTPTIHLTNLQTTLQKTQQNTITTSKKLKKKLYYGSYILWIHKEVKP